MRAPAAPPSHPGPSWQVVSSSFTKSIIRSRAALTYAEAQSRIDDARLTDELSVSCAAWCGAASWPCERWQGRVLVQGMVQGWCRSQWVDRRAIFFAAPSLQTNLRTMNRLARILRAKRAERGALQLASPEVKFEIDTETHDPLDVGMYQVGTAAAALLLLGVTAPGTACYGSTLCSFHDYPCRSLPPQTNMDI